MYMYIICRKTCFCFLTQADEYVVYSSHQQRMQYLVEFSLPGDLTEGEEEGEEGGEEGKGGEVGDEESEEESVELSPASESEFADMFLLPHPYPSHTHTHSHMHLRQLIFLRKSGCLWCAVLLWFLFV